MKTLLLPLLLTAFAKTASAQYNTEFKSDEDIDPRVTEVYVDVPIVKPAVDPGAAPSDATVLFDGKSLAAWRKLDGTPAHWTLADGAMTVALGWGHHDAR